MDKDWFVYTLSLFKNQRKAENPYFEYIGGYVKKINGIFYKAYTFVLQSDGSNENLEPVLVEIAFINDEILKVAGIRYNYKDFHPLFE